MLLFSMGMEMRKRPLSVLFYIPLLDLKICLAERERANGEGDIHRRGAYLEGARVAEVGK